VKNVIAVLIVIAGLWLQQAKADSISFDLSKGNPGISPPYVGPFVSVTVNRTDSTHATVMFTSYQNFNNSGYSYLMGDGSTMALNVKASTFSAAVTAWGNTGTGFTPNLIGDFTVNNFANQNVDGFGRFNLTINTTDGFTHTVSTITVSLTNTSGTWNNVNQVLTLNNNNTRAASHIFVTTYPANASNSALATGYAAEGGATVPDGGTTVMLLGMALGALGVVRRYLMSS
jgi:hypothetical protein